MKYGLIGYPLGHSYSKVIHEKLGKYSYDLNQVDSDEMHSFMKSRDFSGFNVTIPYKKDVIPYCDEITDLAKEIGAVNTLYFEGDKLMGHNTDYEGFLYSSARGGISYEGRNVLILGTGGASLSALAAVKHQGCAKVWRATRADVTPSPVDKQDRGLISYRDLGRIANGVKVIVNTTPIGTYPNNLEKVIDLDKFPVLESVMDVIYNPFRTKILLDAEKRGLNTANGLPMLVAQATAAAGYFLGTPGAFEEFNEGIIKDLESEMKNIVLIGMPGCGKSTVARALGNITGMPVVDMDEVIVEREGMPIPKIFARIGESGFRDIETEVAKDLGKGRGQIIATGGGAILREENVDALRQNATVVYLKRPLAKLATKGRPLSKDKDALHKMAKKRLPLYKAAADVIIDNSRYLNRRKLEEYLKNKLGCR